MSTSTHNSHPPLYRHPTDRRLAGVCGGLGAYFNIDPVFLRLIWIVAAISTGGAAILAYIILWLLLPVGTTATGPMQAAAVNQQHLRPVALFLIAVGILWLLANTGILPPLWHGFWHLVAILFWPAALILLGWHLLRRSGDAQRMVQTCKQKWPTSDTVQASFAGIRQRLPLKRSLDDRMLLGVCGGLARTLNVDSSIVRLLWALFSIGSLGAGVVAYVIAAILMPEETVSGPPDTVEGEVLDSID